LILGLSEFEDAVFLIHEKRFNEAELKIKEALGILKKA